MIGLIEFQQESDVKSYIRNGKRVKGHRRKVSKSDVASTGALGLGAASLLGSREAGFQQKKYKEQAVKAERRVRRVAPIVKTLEKQKKKAYVKLGLTDNKINTIVATQRHLGANYYTNPKDVTKYTIQSLKSGRTNIDEAILEKKAVLKELSLISRKLSRGESIVQRLKDQGDLSNRMASKFGRIKKTTKLAGIASLGLGTAGLLANRLGNRSKT